MQQESDIMVSVSCIVYNHEKFIAQAIESFLMQKTTFKYEIVIGEDCSTDNTRQIVESYASKYPDIIRVVTSETNVGGFRNSKRVISATRGKYVAFCDGDDYWTDELKLQKQIDFLEKNSDYIMCCHYCREVDSANNLLYVNRNPVRITYRYNDLVVNKQQETSTSSIVTRREELIELFENEWLKHCNATDKFIKLFTTFKTGKKVFVLPEVMSSYRKHSGGVWSVLEPTILKQKQLNDFNFILRNFEHGFLLKLSLFIFYIRRYFLFEVRNYRLRGAINTIRTIYY